MACSGSRAPATGPCLDLEGRSPLAPHRNATSGDGVLAVARVESHSLARPGSAPLSPSFALLSFVC